MTAQEIIENTLPLISGSTVSKEDNYDTLLSYLNFAKSKLARDTNLWIGGETIDLVQDQNVYTLSKMPIQIIEIYDDNFHIRERNSFGYLGYTQQAPNKIFVNSPNVGTRLNINYFEEPVDYILSDEVYIPNDLVEAMQYYMAYKVFNVYKSDKEELKSRLHLEQYSKIVNDYIFRTDIPEIESINSVDLIKNKGLI